MLVELETRDLTKVRTETLLGLVLKYGDLVAREHQPPTLRAERPELEIAFTPQPIVDTWEA
ncbi:MAG TPA: hypothetical protein PKM73_20070 [Verrucomicrobiota bacterium]|nr:hypothetical protein [Verrucomicrobiota bacterium]HNU50593.1 hypothetical protein [Verrucomicrobiota bacterium]